MPIRAPRLWVIEFAFGDGAKPVRVKSQGERPQLGPIDERCAKAGAVMPTLTPNEEAGHAWKPDAATWDEVKKHGVAQPVTVRLLGYEDEKAKKPVSSGQTTLSISARSGGRSHLLPRRAADPGALRRARRDQPAAAGGGAADRVAPHGPSRRDAAA